MKSGRRPMLLGVIVSGAAWAAIIAAPWVLASCSANLRNLGHAGFAILAIVAIYVPLASVAALTSTVVLGARLLDQWQEWHARIVLAVPALKAAFSEVFWPAFCDLRIDLIIEQTECPGRGRRVLVIVRFLIRVTLLAASCAPYCLANALRLASRSRTRS